MIFQSMKKLTNINTIKSLLKFFFILLNIWFTIWFSMTLVRCVVSSNSYVASKSICISYCRLQSTFDYGVALDGSRSLGYAHKRKIVAQQFYRFHSHQSKVQFLLLRGINKRVVLESRCPYLKDALIVFS